MTTIPSDQQVIGAVLFAIEASAATTHTAKQQNTAILALLGAAFDLKKKKAAQLLDTVTGSLLRNGIISQNSTSKRLALHRVEGPFREALDGIKEALAHEYS